MIEIVLLLILFAISPILGILALVIGFFAIALS